MCQEMIDKLVTLIGYILILYAVGATVRLAAEADHSVTVVSLVARPFHTTLLEMLCM